MEEEDLEEVEDQQPVTIVSNLETMQGIVHYHQQHEITVVQHIMIQRNALHF